ncbi:uncharacterized protein NP_2326A [Natronomonas pharaonis DSM 2160]|uniref:DUF7847 domain-containing protein n=1 Tax=Natronomonas pharaonis (strain ATCC 35678 / DSM 2160 / CIP 103997 / JCM 8858 / NBRC 14720 / NCIMB 2260 / Gabara) TaxID=348780 RepID=A0A1U7EW08_NATPD|nr:hypothetical protein [Natronomonas pharaonis]CAI49254.1 uncharacterized protein NP_2326A [Natronomonas pharaonis DSM 2160]
MALPIGQTIADGIERAATKTGLVLAVVLIAYQLPLVAATNTLFEALLPAEAAAEADIGLTLPLSADAAAAIAVLGYLFGVAVAVVAARALARPHAALSTFPPSLYTRRILRATLAALVAGLLATVAIGVGTLLLVIPGLFLLVSFAFYLVVIGVEDEGPLSSLRRSWQLASGNRWRLFALILIVGIAVGLVSSVVSIAAAVTGSMVASEVASILVAGFLGIVGYGVIIEAYLWLRENDDPAAAATASM